MPTVPLIRIFISSPGDVNDERKLALEVIEQLTYRPSFREKVAFRVVAWDKPGAGTPMRATLTPQDAINTGLPTPAECDIMVVLFWSRMGTPFTHSDGKEYQSGTHWELLNALEAERPETVIYRRTDDPPLKLSDADFDTKHAQYRAVQTFFASELFYEADGKIKRGYNSYKTPDDFRRAFEVHLEELVLETLNRNDGVVVDTEPEPAADDINISTIRSIEWPAGKSPFPGLRAFTEADAPIFFGRGYETDALVRQLTGSRFVAVVGASGSGKSSLVGAGLIPRLRANAIPGSKDWQIVRLTPGENPFGGLYDALVESFPALKPNPLEARRIKQNFIADLREAPETVLDICMAALDSAPEWAEVLLFVDQFEELFTLTSAEDARAFAAMLDAIAASERVRAVVTMRHDFFNKAVENGTLAELLRAGAVFSLAIPKRDALRQMIERPAERAGLDFDHALVDRILDDTGDEPGNLALMAYALDELYKLDDDNHLTHAEYEQLGGVQGAIGIRAENTFAALNLDQSVIQRVFHALVEVDERGTATRRRERFSPETLPDDVRTLIEAFTDARLLTTSYDPVTKQAMVEVAHEAILRKWERLADWIEATQDDHRIISRMKREARIWEERGQLEHLLPNAETLREFQDACERLGANVDDPMLQAFTEPEQERLYRELEIISTPHERRRDIGDRLAVIGDTRRGVGVRDGLPEIEWLPVTPGGEIEIKSRKFTVKPFYIAKYLVTYAQYQAFAEGDYNNPLWWDGFPDAYRPQELSGARSKLANAPRDKISWYQSVAFARWLDAQLRDANLLPDATLQVRLPTEWEWQWAAQNGSEERKYPWGEWDEHPRANTTEAGINERSTAVGMYPQGVAACGALDMAGNLFEWCANNHGEPEFIDVKNSSSKVLRGGSFINHQYDAAASSRSNSNYPYLDYYYYGVRLVLSRPIGVSGL